MVFSEQMGARAWPLRVAAVKGGGWFEDAQDVEVASRVHGLLFSPKLFI